MGNNVAKFDVIINDFCIILFGVKFPITKRKRS